MDAVKSRNQEIAHWCWLLMESVYCFGDVLYAKKPRYRESIDSHRHRLGSMDSVCSMDDDMDEDEDYHRGKSKLYHSIDCKLSFNRTDFQFDLPLSMTSNMELLVKSAASKSNARASSIDSDTVCLQFEKLYSRDLCNFYLDLSNLSTFPFEAECLVFGAKLGCTDLIYDGLSHNDYMVSMMLYQKIIGGEWFHSQASYPLLHDKYQRRVVKMASQLIKQRFAYLQLSCENLKMLKVMT